MASLEILDPEFQAAVSALDAGDVGALENLLAAHPRLAGDRLDAAAGGESGEAYFRRPYLLWFVAENPVRNGRLPRNIAQAARAILRAAERHGGDVRREQIDHALGLVSSGRVPRESGVQRELIDLLVEAGADPDAALVAALAHREREAVERLLEHGARSTLQAAACLGRIEDVRRLAGEAGADERQAALAGAALYGQAPALAVLIEHGVDVNAFSPADFHSHATALHHAVDSGSLEAVRTLVAAGADLDVRDRIYQGTPLDWSDHLQRAEIAAWLRAAAAGRQTEN